MPYTANYPATVAEVLNTSMTFKREALAAVREFARSKPWRGSRKQREAKFRKCIAALATAYAINVPTLKIDALPFDCYRPATHTIFLTGRMSVVTLLHEFGHARGFDERQTCRWSINLFRRCFPRSYAACQHVRHMLVRRDTSTPASR